MSRTDRTPTRRSRLRHLGASAAALLSVVALAACGSGTAAEQADAPSSADPVSIKVGVPPSVFAASLNLGLTSGIFEGAGYQVELVTLQSAAEGLPQVLSGDLQFSIIESHNAMQSVSEGMPIKVSAAIANYATEAPSDGIGFGNILTLATSDITEPKDLEGKSIGTNSIGGSAYMSYYAALEDAGVDMTTIEWVEAPSSRNLPALRQGQVDAITSTQPNTAAALLEGDVKVIMNADDIFPGAPQFGLASSTQWLAENEAVAKGFMEALLEANALANTDRPAVEEAIASYMDLPPEVLTEVRLPNFATEWWTPESFDPIDAMIERFGLIDPSKLPAHEDVVQVYQ